MSPIQALAEDGKSIWASVVYLDKETYGGPYLRPDSPRGQDTQRFRNFMLRRLLERHFARHPLASRLYDLVLDRVEMSRRQQEELWDYLSDNLRIPAPNNITHAASLYVEGLQIVHHIANVFGSVAQKGTPSNTLPFVNAHDMSSV